MLRIVFAGTPEFALPTLVELLHSNHEICAVYTQPDRPAGRGQKLQPSPIKELAKQNNLLIYQPPSLKDELAQQQFAHLAADILVNVAYGLLLPPAILDTPKFGCINLHPSLLPRWRGAAPIQRAILAGDKQTGVTIMKMDVGLDTGDIYKQTMLPIDADDTTLSLANKTAILGAKMMLEVLHSIEKNLAVATPQGDDQTSYANKITKEEGKIDWHKSAIEIERMVRAFNPWPRAYFFLDGKYIRVWEAKASIQPCKAKVGTIVHADHSTIDIMTINGILSLLKIQLPGGKPLNTKDIANAYPHLFSVGANITSGTP